MLATVLGWLGHLLGGPFAKAAVDAYKAKLSSDNTSEKIAADLAGRELAVEQRERELASEVVIAEEGRWYTALPRPLFAAAFIIYVEGSGLRQGAGPGLDARFVRRRWAMGDDRADRLFRWPQPGEGGAHPRPQVRRAAPLPSAIFASFSGFDG